MIQRVVSAEDRAVSVPGKVARWEPDAAIPALTEARVFHSSGLDVRSPRKDTGPDGWAGAAGGRTGEGPTDCPAAAI